VLERRPSAVGGSGAVVTGFGAGVDAFAVESQKRAAAAQAAGYFDRSVVAVKDSLGQTILARDEFIKPSTTLDGLAALKPSFEQMGAMGFDAVALTRYPQVERIAHVHHAGNSSGIVDGAAAVLIGNEAAAKAHGLTPRARIVATALSGADPTIMLTGPMPATRKALAKAAMVVAPVHELDDFGLVALVEKAKDLAKDYPKRKQQAS